MLFSIIFYMVYDVACIFNFDQQQKTIWILLLTQKKMQILKLPF